MRKIMGWVLLGGLAAGAAVAQEAPAELEQRIRQLEAEVSQLKGAPAGDGLEAVWKRGFRIRSRDDAFELRPRLQVQFDAAGFSEDGVDDALAADAEEGEKPDRLESGSEIRRARFGFEGAIYNNVGYEAVFDFAGEQVEPVDVFVALLKVPAVGTVRVGHQREPFSRLQGGSANYIFMEKGVQDALVPDRNLGIRLLRNAAGGRIAWSAGAFRDTDDTGASTDADAYDLVARASGLPWYEKESGRLLHLGAAYARRRPPDGEFDFGARPESHLAETLAGRDDIPADDADLAGAEAALILGTVSFLGEYVRTELDGGEAFDGYYATASWFLTGETRGYDTEEGKLSGVKPLRNFRGKGGGAGAWELAVRLSGLDLQDGDIDEGELQDTTFALNWYLNPGTKVLLNYIRSDAGALGDAEIIQGRVQLSF
jgi:phosphate-selective porin OprO/OprP